MNICSTLEPEGFFMRSSSPVVPAGVCISSVLSLPGSCAVGLASSGEVIG